MSDRAPGQGLRVALVGAGSWAHCHADAWRAEEDATIAVVYNRSPERGRAFAERHHIPEVVSGPSAMPAMDRDDIDIVSISMPDHLHHEIAMAALERGKHVFCEKPLALDAASAHQMAERARSLGLVTGMQSTRRCAPLVRRMRQLVQEGYLGRVLSIHMSYSFGWAGDPQVPFVWRYARDQGGSGALADLGVYMVDAARWLVGEITSVCGNGIISIPDRAVSHEALDLHQAIASAGSAATTGERRQVENWDEALFLATFDHGAHGVFRASRLDDDQSIRIWGTDGSLLLEHFTPDGYQVDAGTLVGRRRGATRFETFDGDSLSPKSIITDFAASVRGGPPCAPDFHDGWRAQEILDAVDRSIHERVWVDVPGTSEPRSP